MDNPMAQRPGPAAPAVQGSDTDSAASDCDLPIIDIPLDLKLDGYPTPCPSHTCHRCLPNGIPFRHL